MILLPTAAAGGMHGSYHSWLELGVGGESSYVSCGVYYTNPLSPLYSNNLSISIYVCLCFLFSMGLKIYHGRLLACIIPDWTNGNS